MIFVNSGVLSSITGFCWVLTNPVSVSLLLSLALTANRVEPFAPSCRARGPCRSVPDLPRLRCQPLSPALPSSSVLPVSPALPPRPPGPRSAECLGLCQE